MGSHTDTPEGRQKGRPEERVERDTRRGTEARLYTGEADQSSHRLKSTHYRSVTTITFMIHHETGQTKATFAFEGETYASPI